MVKEAKQPKREHPCPHCLTNFRSPSTRDAHARAVHEKWRDHKCPHCSSRFAAKSDMVQQGGAREAARPPVPALQQPLQRGEPHATALHDRPREVRGGTRASGAHDSERV